MEQTRRRFDGYVRVSRVAGREGNSFISPAEQRDRISAWASSRGVEIAMFHEDLDQSGGVLSRPGLDLMMERVRSGQTGGVAVASVDRLSRAGVGEALSLVEEIHAAGGEFAALDLGIDPTTPFGEFGLVILLALGRMQRRRIADSWAAAQDRAIHRGALPGRTSYGLRRLDDGRLEPIPDEAATVARMVRERAAGRGWKSIATGLSKDRIPTPSGNGQWAASTVAGIVSSEAAVGVWTGPRGARVEDAWPAMVDRATWELAQTVVGRRTEGRVHKDRLIGGIARCACCRRVMRRGSNQTGHISYNCVNRGCAARASIGAVLLDRHIALLLDQRLRSIRMTAERADDGAYVSLVVALEQARAAYDHWRADKAAKTRLGLERHTEQLLDLAADVDAASEAIVEHRRAVTPVLAALPGDVSVRLEDLPWGLQVQVADVFLHAVFVRRASRRGPAAAQDIASRIRVEWKDDGSRSELPSPAQPVLGPVEW
jgi:DNA invertase Pin-like site-specific DNA recombinase